MSDVRIKVYATGFKEAAIDAAKLKSVLDSIKRTSFKLPVPSPIQQLRSAIPGLATSIPSWLGSNSTQPIRMLPNSFLAGAQRSAQSMGPLFPGSNVNWKQGALGLAAAPFSPWIGARMMSNAFGGALGGGGGGGGIGAAVFGAGGANAFAAFYVGLRTAGLLLEKFATTMHEAIREGAKLYQQSARTATGTGQMAHLEFMGAALGMSSAELQAMVVRGQHPLKSGARLSPSAELQAMVVRGQHPLKSGARLSPSDIGSVFGAGRGTSQVAGLQQMVNMSREMAEAWKETAKAAEMYGRTAKALQYSHQQMSYLSSELKVLWAQVAALMTPAINMVAIYFTRGIQASLPLLDLMVKGYQGLGLIPKGDPGKNIIPTGQRASHSSAWERMGFVIGGFGGGNDFARQTAQNTKKLVDLWTRAIPRGATTGTNMLGHNLP